MLLPLIIFHAATGGYYREKLRKKYRQDVCHIYSFSRMHVTATDFNSGLFDCFKGHKSVRKCCFACWCEPVRFAANSSATGFLDFWFALIIASFFLPLIWLWDFIGRLHIRQEYGMEPHACSDFFAWLFCYPCALTQESKFVDAGFVALSQGRPYLHIEPPPVPPPDPPRKRDPETSPVTPTRVEEPGEVIPSSVIV